MSADLPEVRGLARRLLRMYSGNGAADRIAAGAEPVLELLAHRISPLLGTNGFEMLLMRAARRAQQRHPSLVTLEVAMLSGEGIAGWASRSVAEGGAEEAAAAAESVLAELIGLIARLLGADMAIRLVRQASADMTPDGWESDPEESNDE